MALSRLTKSFSALRLHAPQLCIARAMSSEAFATTQTVDLSNLILAPEKPVKAPRIVPFANEAYEDDHENINVKLLSFQTADAIGDITLDGTVFGAPSRIDILQRVVTWQLACRRQGTSKAKSRSETSGSTRKPWKQKGGGRARVKDIRAPQWRGGYRVHGPVPRDYSYPLPKKVRHMGLRVALSTKLREGKLAIVDNFDIDITKTKAMKELLVQRGWDNILFVDGPQVNEYFYLSTKNIPYVDAITQTQVNVYSILQRDLLVLTSDAAKYLSTWLHVD